MIETIYSGTDALLAILKQHVGGADPIPITVGLSSDEDTGPFEVGVAIGVEDHFVTLSIDDAKKLSRDMLRTYPGPNGKYLADCLQYVAETAEGMNGVRH